MQTEILTVLSSGVEAWALGVLALVGGSILASIFYNFL